MTLIIILLIFTTVLSSALPATSLDVTCSQPPTSPGSRESDADRLKKDSVTFRNCTIVHGNLMIYNYQLNESYFDFLSQIHEVTGFVLFQNNSNLRRIPLPNLVLIRGERRYEPIFSPPRPDWKPCALCLIANRKLLTLGINRLTDISKGAVTITDSPELCYAERVNWTDVLASDFQLQADKSVGSDQQCKTARCHSGCSYANCFGGEISECHNLTRLVCKGCDDRCVGPTQADCCNPQCTGGCRAAGASDQCFACRNVNNDGRCVERCPDSTEFNVILGRQQRRPDGKVRLKNLCLRQCPSYMAIDGGACVTMCSDGMTEVNGICEPCPRNRACPVYCDGNGAQPEIVRAGSTGVADFVDARNLDRFRNCTHVSFNLRIMPSTFSSARNPNGVQPRHLKEALQHVQLVNGFVEIKVVSGADLESFDFLENLETVHGRHLLEDKYALDLYSQQPIKFLGLRSLKRVNNGNIRAVRGAACAGDTITAEGWSRVLSNSSVQKYEAMGCTTKTSNPALNCSNGCESGLGCWGPADNMCIECRNYRLLDRCVLDCGLLNVRAETAAEPEVSSHSPVDAPLFYGDNTTRTCERCHSQCVGGCVGRLDTNCFACRNARLGAACVAKCPALYWKTKDGVCQPCHENCEAGCGGPSNSLGDDGCYQCYRTVQHENATIGRYCASKTDSCESGYFAMRTSSVKKPPVRNGGNGEASVMSGQRLMCMPCPPGCSNCTDGTPPRCNVCRYSRVEIDPSDELVTLVQTRDAFWNNWIAQIRNSEFRLVRPDAGANSNGSAGEWHSSSVNNDTRSNLAANNASSKAIVTPPSDEFARKRRNVQPSQDYSQDNSAQSATNGMLRGTECAVSFACPSSHFMYRAPIRQECIQRALIEIEAAAENGNENELFPSDAPAGQGDSVSVRKQLQLDDWPLENSSASVKLSSSSFAFDRLAVLPECRESENVCVPCDATCKGGCDGLGAHRCFDCIFARVDLDDFIDDSTLNRTNRPMFECVNECPLRKPHRQQRNETRVLSNGEPITVKVAYCSELEPAMEQSSIANRQDSQRLLILAAVVFFSLCTIAVMYVSYSMRKRAHNKLRAARITAELTGLSTSEDMDDDFEQGDGRHKLHCRSNSIKSKSNLEVRGCCRVNSPKGTIGPAPDMAKLNLIRINELLLGSPIGSGAFGTVYRGLWVPLSPNGENIKIKIPVAVKVLNEPTVREKMDFLEEARVMSSVNHYCCVRVLAVCMAEQMQLVSELLPLGSLLEYVRTHREDIGSKNMLTWATQIAMGMAYLEERKIVHRDLAARNVLVKSSRQVKITDFGLAKLLDPNEPDYIAEGGKLPIKWLALESILQRVFNHKTDVWSFGVTMWEILTYGARPYGNVRAVELSILLEKGERLPQPDICTIDTYLLMVKCWMLDASCRPSFTELVDELARMCHDPGRYLMIPGDELMRLPGAVDYTRDELILNTLNELNTEAIANFRVVPAEDYLRPAWRGVGEGNGPTSSPSAHSVGTGFIVDAAHASAANASNSDGTQSPPSAATNWCYELAGTRASNGDSNAPDMVDGALSPTASAFAPFLVVSNSWPLPVPVRNCVNVSSRKLVADTVSPTKTVIPVQASASVQLFDADCGSLARASAGLPQRSVLRHSQSTELCPPKNPLGGSLGRFSALELEKERRRRDKTDVGDRAIRRAREMRATRYSLDPMEVRDGVAPEREAPATSASFNEAKSLPPRACSSAKAIDTYTGFKSGGNYLPMEESQAPQRATNGVAQPISVRVRPDLTQRVGGRARIHKQVEDDENNGERDTDRHGDHDDDESARISPTMLSPVFSVSTPPSSARTAHNPEYFDGQEQSPLDRTPRSRNDSDMFTTNKTYFLLPTDERSPSEATELLERGRHYSGGSKAQIKAPFSLTTC